MKNKYIGKIYEGRWEVIRFERYGQCKSSSGRYVLKNIYNDNEIIVKDCTLRMIDKEETTVSKIISKKIFRSKHNLRRCF